MDNYMINPDMEDQAATKAPDESVEDVGATEKEDKNPKQGSYRFSNPETKKKIAGFAKVAGVTVGGFVESLAEEYERRQLEMEESGTFQTREEDPRLVSVMNALRAVQLKANKSIRESFTSLYDTLTGQHDIEVKDLSLQLSQSEEERQRLEEQVAQLNADLRTLREESQKEIAGLQASLKEAEEKAAVAKSLTAQLKEANDRADKANDRADKANDKADEANARADEANTRANGLSQQLDAEKKRVAALEQQLRDQQLEWERAKQSRLEEMMTRFIESQEQAKVPDPEPTEPQQADS